MRRTSLNSIYELAKKDSRIVFIGSDLSPGVLDAMKKAMPGRWFMEGVAEQHVVGMAAGMAMEGFIPYVNTIATFLSRRCYEQVALDVCLQNLPVRLIGNGGGVVYAPLGPTHLAIEDIAIMRCLPNMTVVAPCDADEMSRLMPITTDWPGPIYIRLAKGGDTVVSKEDNGFDIGKGIVMRPPGDMLFVTTGIMTQRALQASDKLREDDVNCGVLHLHTIKPLDKEMLVASIKGVDLVVTVEEHVLAGGLGSAVLEAVADSTTDSMPQIVRLGIPDQFAHEYGSQDSLLHSWRLDVDSLVNTVRERLLIEQSPGSYSF